MQVPRPHADTFLEKGVSMPTGGVLWLRKCVGPFELQEEVSMLGRLREGKGELNRIFTGSPEVKDSEPYSRDRQRLRSVAR